MNRKLLFVGVLVALGFSGVAPASAADRPDPERYERQTPVSDIKAGGSRDAVHAPIEVVRHVVTDFDGYSSYIKRFEKAKVIGRHGDKTDVYLQVPIMKGAAKVWAVVRFDPPQPTGNGDDVVVVGKLLKGNVKRLDAKYKISKIDDQNTKLDLELLIVPDFIVPIPNRLVAGEAAYAASRAVLGIRNASEQRSR
jgi:ribosome-associated toxin RatA of RatAB toxin-antitoxin module